MNKFYKIFNENYISKAVSNARVNLIGEHTDYTGGYVLPILLDKKTEIYISFNKNNHNVFSDYFNEMVSFNDLAKSRNNHWVDYIKGSLSIIKSSYDLPDHFFNILISSNIPINRGISSSAAICVSILKAINNYYDLKIDNKNIALIAQKVENEYIGVTGGIMDQMVSSIGVLNKAFFLNCLSLEYKLIDIPKNYLFCLVDSKVQRNLRNSSYNQRYKELKEAEKILSPLTLFNASIEDLNKKQFSNYIIKKRALHVVSENQRVLKAIKALKDNNMDFFGKLMNQSHESYSNDFEASTKEVDEVVKNSLNSGAIGSRLTGGGFGGFVVSLININNLITWKTKMFKLYEKERFLF